METYHCNMQINLKDILTACVYLPALLHTAVTIQSSQHDAAVTSLVGDEHNYHVSHVFASYIEIC